MRLLGRWTNSDLFPLIRRRRYALVEKERGLTWTFALPQPLPEGRALLEFTASKAASVLVYSKGLKEGPRVLQGIGQGRQQILLRLAEGAQSIIIKPSASGSDFELTDVQLRHFGTLDYGGHLVGAKLGRRPAKWPSKFGEGLRAAFEGRQTFKNWLLGFESSSMANYARWARLYDSFDAAEKRRMADYSASLAYRPTISVVLPTYNPPIDFLKRAIDSVRKQIYQNWELCIADDASSDPRVAETIRKVAETDPRIRFVIRKKRGHVSACSNTALALATGEFVALLDHDDELREHALLMVADRLNRNRDLDLIYSDEDKISEDGQISDPYFKPDWNSLLLLQQNFVCHLAALRAESVRELGGFREGYEGSQDWDLFLRLVDGIDERRIAHIPHVLYHWRSFEGSTAQALDAKTYSLEAGRRAVQDFLDTRHPGATVELSESRPNFRVHFPLPDPLPLVSVLIPTRDRIDVLKPCVGGLLHATDYEPIEIVIVDNGSVDGPTLDFLKLIQEDKRVRVVRDDSAFNYARLNNLAAREARGEILCLLNDDTEVTHPGWLKELVSYAVQPEIGAVGARLWYANDQLQHGGIVLGIAGIAGHAHRGLQKGLTGYRERAVLAQNMSAVTGACLAVRQDVYAQVGGLDEVVFPVAFNDVDFCLKLLAAGYRNVWTPYAELLHRESFSRGQEDSLEKKNRFAKETEEINRKWGDMLHADPAYNPNLSLLSEQFELSYPPREPYPWRLRD